MIEDLKHILESSFAANVQLGNDELLATVQLANGRTHRVLVSVENGAFGDHFVVRLRSRVGAANSAEQVAAALAQNMCSDFGGFALDDSREPPVFEIVNQVIASPRIPFNRLEFITAFANIASAADRVEFRGQPSDAF